MSDEEVEEVLKHVRELVARNQRLLLENTRLCEQVSSDDDAKRWIREFRAEHRELRERIVELKLRLRPIEIDRDYERWSVSWEEVADLLGDMLAVLDGENG